MLAMSLSGVRSVVALGAHPDDIEIAAGGMLLTLAQVSPGVRVHEVLLTGSPRWQTEARNAASAFLPGARITFGINDLPDGRLPGRWGEVMEIVEAAGEVLSPDVVLAPRYDDSHYDHRTLAEVVTAPFRDSLILRYEIPKRDGDLGRANFYLPLSEEVAQRKMALLNECFPLLQKREWWDVEIFHSLARLRGLECQTHYAEAYFCDKAVIRPQ